MADILFIEPCDFERYPVGGRLSFARQMMVAFGNRLALVGYATDGAPVGRWVTKSFDGLTYDFLAIGRRELSGRKPVIPARLTAYWDVVRHRKTILSRGIRCAFTQSPETAIAIHGWSWKSLCYMSPGHANPLRMPRYRWGKLFAGLYDAKLSEALQAVDVILACADGQGVADIAGRSKGRLRPEQIVSFPTRVDRTIFHPQPETAIRQRLDLCGSGPFAVTCGRINRVKGWDLLIEAFSYFVHDHPYARLIFVGDGEDRSALERTVAKKRLTRSVLLTGFQPQGRVAEYLSVADVVVVGSRREGWSVAMLEALACGRVVVSTEVSGARDLIVEGQNGLVVSGRDPRRFAAAMGQTLAMETPNPVSLRIAERYSLANLKRDMSRLWGPLAMPSDNLDDPHHPPIRGASRYRVTHLATEKTPPGKMPAAVTRMHTSTSERAVR